MKTLLETILSRELHDPKVVIYKWLEDHRVKNYTLNDKGEIDVDGDVNISYMNIKEFPSYIQFGVVKGYFNCNDNKLISLEGSPREVKEDFVCIDNDLTTLKGAPEKVGGSFYCYSNNLTSLKGAPEKVKGYFNCDNNILTTLEGAPREVGDSFYCDHNKLVSLKGAPKKVKGCFNCSNNSTQFTEEDVMKVCKVEDGIRV